MVEIVNISAGGDIHREVDLEELSETLDLPMNEFDEEANRLLLRYRTGGEMLILFRTGKYILRGGDSYDGCYEARDKFYEILVDCGLLDDTDDIDFRIQNVVCTEDLGKTVELELLAPELGLKYVDYEPEQFPGLVYRPPERDYTMMIYSSGKLIITGAPSEEVAEQAMEEFWEHI
ncbi:hypothetical protein DQW50_04145 [Halorubrum sp. 48-1-W]|uniref:hypothetical protein n=1 Tax=Halorubrum sp. 48-1-W TaxID=2249761 RepID=UPI000DCCAC1B|nr:hypothetical protein [Halorubrum sp. 48-1-W]RAW46429.1 hypothetical protein DQW50_04145 [Halorubrum sp. 48-1-W]